MTPTDNSRHRRRLGASLVIATFLGSACGTASPSASPLVAPSAATPSTVVASSTVATPSAQPTSAIRPSASASPAEPFELFGTLPKTRIAAARAAAMQAVLNRAVAYGAPDTLAAVITPEGLWSGASGRDSPNNRAAVATDEFYIASLTKLFTASLVMRLVEQGKIAIDAPIANYLGDLKVDSNGATVRQVLGMTSGLADYPSTAAADIQADTGRRWTVDELIAHFQPIAAAPGTEYIYGNPGYVLLGQAIEHVTGTSLAKAFRGELLDPVSASRIVDQTGGGVTPKPWALPFGLHGAPFADEEYGKGGVISCISSVSFSYGGGSMASDAPSLAAFTWRLFNGELISRDSLTAMLPAAGGDHGLGIERLTFLGDGPIFGQTGSKTGYGSLLAVDTAHRSIVVLFVNDPDFIYDAYASDLLHAAAA